MTKPPFHQETEVFISEFKGVLVLYGTKHSCTGRFPPQWIVNVLGTVILQADGTLFTAQNCIRAIILTVKAKCTNFGMVFIEQQ